MAEGFEALKEEYLRRMREMYAARPQQEEERQEAGRELVKEAVEDVVDQQADDQNEPPDEKGLPTILSKSAADSIQTSGPADFGLTDIPLPPGSTASPEPIVVEETEVLDPDPAELETLPKENGEGRLLVKVVTARGALPVPRARVVVSREIDGQRLLQGYDETNESGLSRVFTLPAPEAGLSMSPDNKTPYARYIVTVSADGYIPAEYRGVPVFDGIQSVQQADIQPLLEGQPEDTGMQSYDGAQQQGVETESPDGYQKEGAAN